MNVPRIFYPRQCDVSSVVELTDTEAVHKIRDVLRLKKGDSLCLFDGQGNEYHCRIDVMSRKSVLARVETITKAEKGPAVKIQLGLALIREQRLEIAVEKATELGVDGIIFFPTERSMRKQLAASRLERLRKIITEASRQSGRNVIPGARAVKTFSEFIQETQDSDCRIFLEAYQETTHIGEVVQQAKNILLCVGPEGDFTESEKAVLKGNGFISWHFPLPVLRAETAAMFGVGLIRYLLNRHE